MASTMRRMLTNQNDLALFLRIVGADLSKDSQETLRKYIEKGGRSKDVRIATHPEEAVQKPQAPNEAPEQRAPSN